MPRDSSTKLSKREQIKQSNKKAEADRKKKKNACDDKYSGKILSRKCSPGSNDV